MFFFFFSSRRRHTRCGRDWSSDVCSSDLHPRRRDAAPPSTACGSRSRLPADGPRSEERRVGKSVDLGGRRIIKKKKKKNKTEKTKIKKTNNKPQNQKKKKHKD